jgi:hypothetical protein
MTFITPVPGTSKRILTESKKGEGVAIKETGSPDDAR